MEDRIQLAFAVGILVAEQVHGVKREGNGPSKAMFDLLQQVADGDVTLLDTPEELVSDKFQPPAELMEKAPAAMDKMRERFAEIIRKNYGTTIENHKIMARQILDILNSKLGS